MNPSATPVSGSDQARRARKARVIRYGAVAAVWIVVIGVSRQFVPQSSSAAPSSGGEPHLGTLQGRDFIVRIHAGSEGPLYDVRTLDGHLLRADLRGDELASEFPELDASSMITTPGVVDGRPLMYADPEP